MSMIHFQPIPVGQIAAASARYLPADYSLVVGPDGNIPPGMNRVSIDTVSFALTPDEKLLVGLDAYTNADRWERRPLARPVIDQETALKCIEPFDEYGIARGNASPVRYSYSSETAILLMTAGEIPVASRIRCLTCVVVGLGAGGELAEIWVEGCTSGVDHGGSGHKP
jgi:hypothetical protein